MKVQVVGGGAVGLLISSFLAEMDAEVVVVCRTLEQAAQLSKGLIRTNVDGTMTECSVSATTTISEDFDVTFVTVKSGQLVNVLSELSTNHPNIFCQNGLAHFDVVNARQFKQAIFCAIQFGVTKVGANHILHKGYGLMKLAAIERYPIIEQLLMRQKQAFPMMFVKDPYDVLFEKALLNTCINPLTAILQVKNGQLIDNAYAFELLQSVHHELQKAFGDRCVPFQQVVELCEKTSNNISSMLADHLASKKSEAPAIMGVIIDEAKKRGVNLPIVSSLYLQVNTIEQVRGYEA